MLDVKDQVIGYYDLTFLLDPVLIEFHHFSCQIDILAEVTD